MVIARSSSIFPLRLCVYIEVGLGVGLGMELGVHFCPLFMHELDIVEDMLFLKLKKKFF